MDAQIQRQMHPAFWHWSYPFFPHTHMHSTFHFCTPELSQHQSNEVHTPTHSYALNLSFPCMCSPHLLGLKHLHNTPTKSIPHPPQAVALQPWPQETRPNCTANIITHTLRHPDWEVQIAAPQRQWRVEIFLCLGRKGKEKLISYQLTYLLICHTLT